MKYIHSLLIIVGVLFLSCGEQIPSKDMNGNGEIDLYEDNNADMEERVADALSRMTLEEKVNLVVGQGFSFGENESRIEERVPGAAGNTYPIESLGIPAMVLADGPAGLRIQPQREGTDETFYATAFPIATLVASSWDTELAYDIGESMGNEVKEYGVDVLLAPALNIHRTPLAGRNFEYYSEDPLLAGKMTASVVNGVESQGVGTSIKHYAANNQETNRMMIDAIISERALREIYLRGFEIAVKEANPWTVMSAYNRVNGTYASQSHDLLEKVLREDWGFTGLVMTDWFAGNDAIAQMEAGNDLLMPGTEDQLQTLMDAVESGDLSEDIIDRNAGRILGVVLRSPTFLGYNYSNDPNLDEHAQTARKIAAEGMVLLKNEDNALPVSDDIETIAAFGNTSYSFITGGTGSGDVNEAYTVSLVEGLLNAGYTVDEELMNTYTNYMDETKEAMPEPENPFMPVPPIPEMELNASLAQQKAQTSDIAFITIGRNSGEFEDRKLEGDFYLTDTEKEMIATVTEAFHAEGKKVITILNIGNVIEVESWKDHPDAILLSWQGGQEGGNAVTDILSGEVNPSGKIPTTFPVDFDDIASSENFPGENLSDEMEMGGFGFPIGFESEVIYEEDIYVGYRYFNTFDVPVTYEFGYGLSYTTFEYGDLELSSDTFNEEIEVTVEIINTGSVAGKEVVQLYLNAPEGDLNKPSMELKGFDKTRLLEPGESQKLTFTLTAKDLASYDEDISAWVAESGEYTVQVGASSRDIRSEDRFSLEGEQVVEETTNALVPEREIDRLGVE